VHIDVIPQVLASLELSNAEGQTTADVDSRDEIQDKPNAN